jgi:hypothetical protein
MEWLGHDYGNGGVVNILVVDIYSGMELCTLILLDEASKQNLDGNSFSKKSQNSQWTHPLKNLNINQSCYVDSI